MNYSIRSHISLYTLSTNSPYFSRSFPRINATTAATYALWATPSARQMRVPVSASLSVPLKQILSALSLCCFHSLSSFLSVCLPTDISIMKRKGSHSSSSSSASLTHVVTFPGEINAPIVPFIISHFHLHLHLHFPPPQCPPARVIVVVR